MNTKTTVAFLLTLLFSVAMDAQRPPSPEGQPAAGNQPAAGDQPTSTCLTMADLWGDAVEEEANAPTGEAVGGITLADVLRSLIAGVEGVGLEEGSMSTTLTWNLNRRVAALVEVLNEPELFGPIQNAIQDDSLRQLLADRVGPGDDLTFAFRYVHKSGSDGVDAGTDMIGRAAAYEWYSSYRNFAQTYLSGGGDGRSALLSEVMGTKCLPADSLEEVRKDMRDMAAAVMNVSEWEARAYYRQRDSLVGPSQLGFNAKYTWAIGDANSMNGRRAMKDMFIANVMSELKEPADADLLGKPSDLEGSEETFKKLRRQQRFSFQVSYDESEKFSFTSLVPGPISLERSRELVGTAAFSLEFPGDYVGGFARLPRYEVQLSYEDVEGDPTRQNRFVARALVSKGFLIMGETTDLSFGLVYASEPEFLTQEDIDEQLSARFGLSFKFGGAGGRTAQPDR